MSEYPLELLTGMAKCIDNEAVEELEFGAIYYIQEIPKTANCHWLDIIWSVSNS
jgi:hypothetical protein